MGAGRANAGRDAAGAGGTTGRRDAGPPRLNLTGLLDLAVEAAAGAGDLLLERFERPAQGVTAKTSPTDLVSDADRDAEHLLLTTINAARPDDGVLAEERGSTPSASGLTWVVDPLDGTVNFLFGIPVWAVSVAVEDRDGSLVGVVHDPIRKETFTATRGGGSRLNDEPIRVSEAHDLSLALVGTGFAYDRDLRRQQSGTVARLLPDVRDIRRAGSAALDLAWLACGRLDGFYESHMGRWDKAAGTLLVEQAGGIVTELANSLEQAPGVIAAGPRLHPRLSSLVLG